jgi:hypothetical protein
MIVATLRRCATMSRPTIDTTTDACTDGPAPPSSDREVAVAEALRGVPPGKARDWLARLLRDGERAGVGQAGRQDAAPPTK